MKNPDSKWQWNRILYGIRLEHKAQTILIAYAFSSDTPSVWLALMRSCAQNMSRSNIMQRNGEIHFGHCTAEAHSFISVLFTGSLTNTKTVWFVETTTENHLCFLSRILIQYFCFRLVKAKINDFKMKIWSKSSRCKNKPIYNVVSAQMETVRYTCAYERLTSITLMLIMLTISFFKSLHLFAL